MRRIQSTAFAVLTAVTLVAGLASCSTTAPNDAEVEAVPAATSTKPAIDPGPVTLTTEEAAERYLSIVCPNNIVSDQLYAAFVAGSDAYYAGGAPDPAAVVAAGVAGVEAHRLAIEQLDDTYFEWPELVAAQIPHIRSSYMSELGRYASISTAATYAEAFQIPATVGTTEENAAGQEIRYQLAISADTEGSCVGREAGLTTLAEEKAERDAALEE